MQNLKLAARACNKELVNIPNDQFLNGNTEAPYLALVDQAFTAHADESDDRLSREDLGEFISSVLELNHLCRASAEEALTAKFCCCSRSWAQAASVGGRGHSDRSMDMKRSMRAVGGSEVRESRKGTQPSNDNGMPTERGNRED